MNLDGKERVLWKSLCTSNVTVQRTNQVTAEEDGEETEEGQDDLWEYDKKVSSTRGTRSHTQRKMEFYVPSAHNMDILPGPDREGEDPETFCIYQASMLGVHQNSFAEIIVWVPKPRDGATDVYRTAEGAKCKPRIQSQTTVISMPTAESGTE